MSEPSLADRLLDAQVAWILDQLTGDGLPDLLARDVDDVLAIAATVRVGEVVEPAAVKDLLHALLERVPASAAASTVVGVAADATYDGPTVSFTAADLVERVHVEAVLREAFGQTEIVGAVLDRVAESPLAAGLASRFVTRIVGEVLASNRAVAEKIPGMGSLVSLGSSMAGKVVGAADKQIEGLLGDTAGKGAQFAMRRLNKVLVATLEDPSALAAALEVWDLYADQPLSEAASTGRLGSREDVHRVAGLVQDIVIDGAATAPVLTLVDRIVDGFFAAYGEESAAGLIDDLGLTRDEILAHTRRIAPGLIARLVESGHAERVVRERLAPFFASPEVAAILA